MSRTKDLRLRCTGCGREYPCGTYSCPNHDGIILAEYDLPSARSLAEVQDPSQPGIWEFSRVLPDVACKISFAEGSTPLVASRAFGKDLEIDLYIKDEGRNPTGSFKDRAASLLLSTEKELGHSANATATSGNAGGALALYSRLAGIDSYLFAYHPTREKFLHMKSFGATLFIIETDRESEMTHLTEEACHKFNWALLTTMASANPFNVEGYKTISYEVVREIGLPDVVVTPVGSGTLALGIWKGFLELQRMGIISGLPRLVGVQAERVNPIARAFERGLTEVGPVAISETIATGLVLDNPGVTGTEALRAIRQSEGSVISVPEKEIARMTRVLPLREGIFAEPSGAISMAGVVLARECGQIAADERVVCVNTGSGFKDMSVLESIGKEEQIFHIPPEIEAIREILEELGDNPHASQEW